MLKTTTVSILAVCLFVATTPQVHAEDKSRMTVSDEMTPNQRRAMDEKKAAGKSAPAAETLKAESQTAPQAKAQAAAESDSSLAIEKMVIASGVSERQPTGESTNFTAANGPVYCWTKVTAGQTPTKITHVWSMDGSKVAEVALDINFPSTRTWSKKTVQPGNWKVEAVDSKGAVLATQEFKVE
jgi:hypothetical protein